MNHVNGDTYLQYLIAFTSTYLVISGESISCICMIRHMDAGGPVQRLCIWHFGCQLYTHEVIYYVDICMVMSMILAITSLN